MDLPHDTPAGSETASAHAGREPVFAGEKRNIAPVAGGGEPTHSSGGDEGIGRQGLRRFFPAASGSKRGFPFVLGGMTGAERSDSTEGFHGRRETDAHKQ